MTRRRSTISAVVFCLVSLLSSLPLVMGQEMGAEPEMSRLEQRAEALIAQGDPEGASLSIGKAAMMATELEKQVSGKARGTFYRALQKLFRAQEQVFRALALFERGGGTPPASPALCLEFIQAQRKIEEARRLFQSQDLNVPEGSIAMRVQKRLTTIEEWQETVRTLRDDLDCRSS